MKRTYSLFQQHIAYILLISLLLQSCENLDSSIIPTKKDQAAISSADTEAKATILQTNRLPLIGEELVAQGAHSVTFYEEDDKLRANVEKNSSAVLAWYQRS